MLFILSASIGTLILSGQAQQASKPVAAAKPTSLPYSSVSFNSRMEVIPVGFKGHDFAAIHKKLSVILKKDEFESTKDFETRVTKATSKPLVGQVYASSLVALVTGFRTHGGYLPVEYDADTQKLQADLSFF